MKTRPMGFLGEDLIDHDGEIMDYIQELHEYLWRFVRGVIPSANGVLGHFVDKALAQLEKENEVRQTASAGWICPSCGSVYAIWVAKCSMCGPKTTVGDTSNPTDWRGFP